MDNYAWLLIICMIIGLFGTFIPLFPGLWLMCGSILVYGIFDSWQDYSVLYFIIVFALSAVGSFIDFSGSLFAAKKFGASNFGNLGAIAGSVLGGLTGKFSGAFLGNLLGVFSAELYKKRSVNTALKASAGSIVGMAISVLAQFLIAIILLFTTVIKLWG